MEEDEIHLYLEELGGEDIGVASSDDDLREDDYDYVDHDLLQSDDESKNTEQVQHNVQQSYLFLPASSVQVLLSTLNATEPSSSKQPRRRRGKKRGRPLVMTFLKKS
ncbi:hypothetical protein HHI36_015695 [Cryptolaemus montrouzieri]|uniref:Uncharacterized protein n=1 Tax=Cryptolaemus montrouzieri TaxID=559131 RepID=A0ABD2N6C2_9CUCU